MLKDDRFQGITFQDVRRDFTAGITVGIVAIPLGMAFAIASGVKPEYGLYTTIIAGIIVALLGGSRFQIAGPTGAFIPILLAIVLQYGYENLLIAGFLAGIMLVLMSFFKLGNLIKFIPRSVTIGFTSGIAVIIFTGQIGDFLGLEGVERKEYFHQNMMELFHHLSTVNFYSVATALIGFIVIIGVPRLFPRIPILLVALIVPTLIAYFFYPGKIETIGTAFGGIAQSLPQFQLPEITWEKILLLWQPAFVIAMLGGIESLLSAVVADGMTGKRHHSNKELFGQGIANIITPLFGGIPATGAIARTATNIKSGAVSPLSGVFQGLFVLVTLLLFAPFAAHIPLASMAPILMVVAFNMSEYKTFFHMVKMKSSDSVVLVVTFLLTVFVNLTAAVQVGLLLAMFSFIKRMSEVLEVEKIMPKLKSSQREEIAATTEEDYQYACPKLTVFTVEGALFFGAADKFQTTISRSINKRPDVIVLVMKRVPFMDATGVGNLTALVNDFHKKGGRIFIAEANEQVLAVIRSSGLFDKIGEQNFFRNGTEAINTGLDLVQTDKCTTCQKQGASSCQVFEKRV